ncbi:MAG: nickel pincer cofactor biosynthesis protein LarC [Acidobacteria bacterium]|nr:nickel pincer cofactor biosynthesis protein LarC [Acidobacteriota bacterium]
MQTLYFDCFAGISGDMTIGALLDLGLDFKALELELKKLSLDGYQLNLKRVLRSQISASKFDVVLNNEHNHHHNDKHSHEDDHSHEHNHHHHHNDKHSHKHDHSHEHNHHHHHHDDKHSHEHENEHHHAHTHDHNHKPENEPTHAHHTHEHRGLKEIYSIIDNSTLSNWVKETSKKIFYRLAIAEGKIHNIAPEQVHFHEVGAIDAIVDIIGACIGFELLGITNFLSSPLHVGKGFVNCAHGRFPIPAPATLELLKGIPTYSADIEGELVTPTGAAIVSTLCTEFIPLPEMCIEKVGYGAGNRDPKDFPNVLRLFYGELTNQNNHKTEVKRLESAYIAKNLDEKATEKITVIEANIDDMNPQIFGYLMEKLLKQGALDVFYTPIYMKKNRPGVLLTILLSQNLFDSIAATLFQETTTLGIRYYETNRRTLARHSTKVLTPFGEVEVKFASLEKKIINVMPEYESCSSLAKEANLALALVQTAALTAFEKERETLQKEL